ncbi:hypothetical protein BSKO_05740 [Bryopsis sp. KO-2023]|nr:hypothetical protein BSKO_05740 [Bryopsis sp. KO-2023]
MGYGLPPWGFEGRAIYQLQLVKSKEARKYIPDDLKLVEMFGYTLGGFYLARYTNSPVGVFDELVVLGGLVWNPPTSCAWAARVYVSNKEARNHGLKHVGLPSRFAKFHLLDDSEEETNNASTQKNNRGTWWSRDQSASSSMDSVTVTNLERRRIFGKQRGLKPPVCTFVMKEEKGGWKGPRIKMFLPSFSGCTPECPKMVKYSLELNTNVRPISSVHLELHDDEDDDVNGSNEFMTKVLSGKPVLSLSFENMQMLVDPPEEMEKSVETVTSRAVQPAVKETPASFSLFGFLRRRSA